MGGKWLLKLALAGHDEVILGRFKKNHCYFCCWSEIVFLFKETDLEIGLQFHSCFVNATNDEFFRCLKNNLKTLLFSKMSTESAIRVLLPDKSPFLCSQTLYSLHLSRWNMKNKHEWICHLFRETAVYVYNCYSNAITAFLSLTRTLNLNFTYT